MNHLRTRRAELRAGQLGTATTGVLRLVAPNGGPMTGPGTNSYLLGGERTVLIDPGPAILEHVEALKSAAPRLRYVLVTHTHRDHSPAAALLRERMRVELIGLPPPPHDRQDQSFVPDRQPADGELLRLDDVSLRAVHTPGHASNHVCYLLDGEGLLFTGDHIMQGSTVVIPPPDGDMRAYLDSLHKVEQLEPQAIAPGHGAIIDDPARAVRRLIRHRLQREARVLDRLKKLRHAATDELLPLVYADVDPLMWPVAVHSLRAHLLKLEQEGRVTCEAGRWSVVAG